MIAQSSLDHGFFSDSSSSSSPISCSPSLSRLTSSSWGTGRLLSDWRVIVFQNNSFLASLCCSSCFLCLYCCSLSEVELISLCKQVIIRLNYN